MYPGAYVLAVAAAYPAAKRVTSRLLRQFEACDDQLALFRELFPDGAEPTAENLCIAHANGLNVDWLIQHAGLSLWIERNGGNSNERSSCPGAG